jgi:hypothetical protein
MTEVVTGAAVRQIGSDIKSVDSMDLVCLLSNLFKIRLDELVIPKGTRIGPAEVGLLCCLGILEVISEVFLIVMFDDTYPVGAMFQSTHRRSTINGGRTCECMGYPYWNTGITMLSVERVN